MQVGENTLTQVASKPQSAEPPVNPRRNSSKDRLTKKKILIDPKAIHNLEPSGTNLSLPPRRISGSSAGHSSVDTLRKITLGSNSREPSPRETSISPRERTRSQSPRETSSSPRSASDHTEDIANTNSLSKLKVPQLEVRIKPPVKTHELQQRKVNIQMKKEEIIRFVNQDRIKLASRRCSVKEELVRLRKAIDLKKEKEKKEPLTFSDQFYHVHAEHPNALIQLAVSADILQFMDDNGENFAIEDLFRDLQKLTVDTYPDRVEEIEIGIKRHQCMQQKSILEIAPAANIYRSPALNPNEEICFKLLLNLSPYKTNDQISNKKIPDLTFTSLLCSYHDYITTPQLLNLIKLILLEPCEPVPLITKLRMLMFCRVWLKSNLFEEEKLQIPEIQECFKKIIKTCNDLFGRNPTLDNLELLKCCEEFEIFFMHSTITANFDNESSINTEFSYVDHTLKFEKALKEILLGHYPTCDYLTFLEQTSNDLMQLAQHTVQSINPLHCISDRSIKQHPLASIFSNTILNLVKFTFLDLLKNENTSLEAEKKNEHAKFKSSSGEHKSKILNLTKFNFIKHPVNVSNLTEKDLERICFKYIDVFVELTDRLRKKNDFCVSFGIYTIIDKLFGRIIDQKMERTTKPLFEEHRDFFSPLSTFKNISLEIDNCRLNRLSYVPNLQSIYHKMIHSMDKIDQTNEEGITSENERTFHFNKSQLLHWMYELIQDGIRDQVKRIQSPVILQTNVQYHLLKYQTALYQKQNKNKAGEDIVLST